MPPPRRALPTCLCPHCISNQRRAAAPSATLLREAEGDSQGSVGMRRDLVGPRRAVGLSLPCTVTQPWISKASRAHFEITCSSVARPSIDPQNTHGLIPPFSRRRPRRTHRITCSAALCGGTDELHELPPDAVSQRAHQRCGATT